jgi:hypothetical protein
VLQENGPPMKQHQGQKRDIPQDVLIHSPAEVLHFPLDIASYKLYYVNYKIGPKPGLVDILCESTGSRFAAIPSFRRRQFFFKCCSSY